MNTAKVGFGLGVLALEKKAATELVKIEILLELNQVNNQIPKCLTIKKDLVTTKHQSEFISSTTKDSFF
ncbi:MAG: hypothetical protein DHS20C18_50350 [Saprospiraceae bacterium]|nr:MAG: hypothetical protein DHS20C18_50350 [Saprospiraceae bacterium]